jgi:pimeloyl-ACP methyl ester carboxylesterase
MFLLRVWFARLLALCGLGFIWINPSAPLTAQPPVFQLVPCPDEVRYGVECGFVTVPADYDDPEGETLRIFVGRDPNEDSTIPPTFVLTGGPGEVAMPYYLLLATEYGFNFADLVVIDQRSTGQSEPDLTCPEFDAAVFDYRHALDEASAAALYAVLAACGDAFRQRDIDPAHVNTNALADDVASVAAALGYERINLYGISYGTRWALRVMDRHPELVHAAVLDSVIPPQVDRVADTPNSAEFALQRVFAACAADTACNREFPDLDAVYQRVHERLRTQPAHFTVIEGWLAVERRHTLTLPLFQVALFNSLYLPAAIAEIPALLYFLDEEQYDRFGTSLAWQLIQPIREGLLSYPTFFAIECQGEVAYSSREALEATYEKVPDWRNALGINPGISSPHIFDLCADWGLTEPSEGENDPVESDAHVLLLAGEFDPVTPPYYLDIVAAGMPNAEVIEMAGQSHASTINDLCANGLAFRFLQAPVNPLATGCVDAASLRFWSRADFAP